MNSKKVVIPAQAGTQTIHNPLKKLDPDENRFYLPLVWSGYPRRG